MRLSRRGRNHYWSRGTHLSYYWCEMRVLLSSTSVPGLRQYSRGPLLQYLGEFPKSSGKIFLRSTSLLTLHLQAVLITYCQ